MSHYFKIEIMKYMIIMLFGFLLCACETPEFTPYSGKDYVQFTSSTVPSQSKYEVSFKWVSVDANLDYDTLYLPIQTVGRISDRDRHVMVKQELYLESEYVYDERGAVIDTIIYKSPNQAVEGVHFMPFDNSGVRELMKIHANSVSSEMAIVLKRDRNGEKVARKLKIRLIDTDEILAGDTWATTCVITIE